MRMKICGFHRSRTIIMCFLAVLTLSSFFHGGVNAFSVVRSSKSNGFGDVDTFSNPISTCSPVGCSQVIGAAGCKAGDCCICQCGHRTPNYVIHSETCVTDEQVEDCEYSTMTPDGTIAVKDMSKGGVISFEADVEVCNRLTVMQWMYQLDKPRWKEGQPNNFIVNGDGSNSQWSLQWDTGLDRKYSGLILRFDLTCPGHYTRTGCLLLKSKGNYSLSEASSSSPPVAAGPNDVMVNITERKVDPTARSEKGGNSPATNGAGETFAKAKKELAEKNHSVVAVGVSLSLVVGIGLICVIMLRKAAPRWLKGQKRAQDAAYEEPVNPSTTGARPNNARTFHNEFYDADCVLTIDGQTAVTSNTRISRLGPLPPLPTQEEPIYEEPVIPSNAGDHGLAKETNVPTGPIQTDPITKEEPPPVYNTLEAPSDDEDDYDDTVDVRGREV